MQRWLFFRHLSPFADICERARSRTVRAPVTNYMTMDFFAARIPQSSVCVLRGASGNKYLIAIFAAGKYARAVGEISGVCSSGEENSPRGRLLVNFVTL